MNLKASFLFSAAVTVLLNAAGCAEWQTTPVTVDQYRGLAVNRMIETQTMYPEHAWQEQQVMTLDAGKCPWPTRKPWPWKGWSR